MARAAVHRLQILAAAALFSTGGAAIKACALTSWQLASLRSGIAAAALFAALPAWRAFYRPRCLLVGAAYAATMILFVSANKLTTAASTIFLQATAPMYLLLLGPLLLGERVGVADVLYTAVLGAGMTLFFVGSETPTVTAPDPVRGDILGAFSGLTWALTLVGLRWLGQRESVRADSVGAAVIAGNLLAFAFALPWGLPFPRAAAADWLTVAYLGLFQIGLAYFFLTRGVRHVRALEAGLLLLLEPVLNVVWAWWIHGEQPGGWSLAGCAVILIATLTRTWLRG